MKKKFTFLKLRPFSILVLLSVGFIAFAQTEKTITNSDIIGDVVFDADTVYILDGFVFVEDGESLTIEAGTVVRGMPGQGESASALIVKRGGQIFANGTSDNPVIMTTNNDPDLDMPNTVRGEWGGLILLGKGTHSNLDNNNEIEGVPAAEAAYYGGNLEDDSSGELHFVSIRHGGSALAPDEEINGLTLGACGTGTIISHVEVIANDDDGVEWFGGAPQCDHLLVSYCADDAFDYDEGYHGNGQFWVAIQTPGLGDNLGEHDGGPSSNRWGEPFSVPVISNVSYIGRGDGDKYILTMKEYTGGMYYNSIFVNQAKGARFEYLPAVSDVWTQIDTLKNLVIRNSTFYNVAGNVQENIFNMYNGNGTAPEDTVPVALQEKLDMYFSDWNNEIAAGDIGVSAANPVPSAATREAFYAGLGSWFVRADFRGAFDPAVTGGHWAGAWTNTFSGDVYDATISLKPAEEKTITNNDIVGNVTFDRDTIYILDGFVFVEDGEVLTIEDGTVIKGLPGQGESASALIVKRGGKIFANGTATNPIIMTTANDANLDLPETVRGEWGGLILLGKGTNNNLDNNNEIEGVPEAEEAYYGGNLEDDSSGELHFVSIRHGGSALAPDEEINGLTLGACGSGTIISYVEVIANDDDGVEWFGGAPACDHLLVSYCADDAFDWDEGFHGNGQFWAAIQPEGLGDNLGEHDGGPSSNRYGEPYSHPVISNATYLGRGDGGKYVLTLREFTGGEYVNSIFQGQAKGVRFEYVPDARDVWAQIDTLNNLALKNNIFYDVAGNVQADIFNLYNPDNLPIPSELQNKMDIYFSSWNNTLASSSLGITKANPVPTADVSGADFTELDNWYVQTPFKGAFNPDASGLWAGEWSKTFADLTFDSTGTSVVYTGIKEIFSNRNKISEAKVFPNPVISSAVITFENPYNESFTFELYNVAGGAVKTVKNIREPEFTLYREKLNSGIYFYDLKSPTVRYLGKIIVK